MNRHPFPLCFVLTAGFALTAAAAGCGPRGPGATTAVASSGPAALSAPPTAAVAALPTLPTLPRAAATHPAPADTPDIDRAETAAAENPRDPGAAARAAYAYYKVKAFAQAVPAFAAALALKPDDPGLLLYRGWAQMAMGTLPDAIETFTKATLVPTATAPQKGEAFLGMGDCWWAMKQDTKAAEAFSRSIGIDSRQGRASLALGTFAASQGRTAQARAFFVDATHDLTDKRDQAQAWACLGRLAEDAKDPKIAAQAYRKAVALDPKNVWATGALPKVAKAAPGK